MITNLLLDGNAPEGSKQFAICRSESCVREEVEKALSNGSGTTVTIHRSSTRVVICVAEEK